MRFNSTYQPTMNLKTTILATAELQELLFLKINSWFKFLKINPPLYFEEDSDFLTNINYITRQISFDTLNEYRVACLTLSHTSWMQHMIWRLNLEYETGLYCESNLIWRDLPELPTNSITKHELIFQIKIKPEDEFKVVKSYSKKLYSLIYDLATLVNEKYNITNIWPQHIDFITSQMTEHELPNASPRNREREFALQKEAFILQSAGLKLFSGKRHSDIPPFIYNLKHCYQIIMNDRNNHLPLKVATIALLANGVTLKDQAISYGYEKILTKKFYQALLEKNDQVLEIKINIPRLMMALLAKGHIGEVQAGVWSTESQQIKDKYNIEII